MNLIINGKNEEIDNEISTTNDLLILKKVESPETVSVQINGKFIKKENYSNLLYDGDEIDFLYFMGGG